LQLWKAHAEISLSDRAPADCRCRTRRGHCHRAIHTLTGSNADIGKDIRDGAQAYFAKVIRRITSLASEGFIDFIREQSSFHNILRPAS
jgi:hypothetical protein